MLIDQDAEDLLRGHTGGHVLKDLCEVLNLMVEGKSTQQMAHELGIKKSSVAARKKFLREAMIDFSEKNNSPELKREVLEFMARYRGPRKNRIDILALMRQAKRPESQPCHTANTPGAAPIDRWARLSDAAALAFQIHAEQLRKGTTTPYLSHLLAVASIVLEHGGDEDQACAALLHDAIEDGGAIWEPEILKRFGPRVAAIVRACTDADTLPKPPWRARKEDYLAHIEAEGADALLVSAADKLHNARAIVSDLRTHGPDVFARFNAGQEGTIWYYGALAEVFARRLPGPLSRELSDAVAQMQGLAAE